MRDAATGRVTKVVYGTGARAEYVFDGSGALSKVSHFAAGGTLIASAAYDYDPAGNVTKTALADNLTYKGDATVTYRYDDLYRLTKEYCKRAENSSRMEYGYGYEYDAVGNRTKMTFYDGSSTATTTYEYSPRNELTKMTAGGNDTFLYYDLRGNLTKKQGVATTEYAWSSEDKLTKVYDGSKTVEYKYDFAGRRVAKRVNSDTWRYYFYDGLSVIAEGTGTTNKVCYTNAPGPIGGLITRGDGSTTYTYHFDRLGNVMAVTDTSGNPYALYTMDGFGNVLEKGTGTGYLNEHATDPQPYHNTTKECDGDTGLYYFGARWYDCVAGRFLSQEPSRVDGPNLYHFNYNNPLNRFDPNGMGSIELEPWRKLDGSEIWYICKTGDANYDIGYTAGRSGVPPWAVWEYAFIHEGAAWFYWEGWVRGLGWLETYLDMWPWLRPLGGPVDQARDFYDHMGHFGWHPLVGSPSGEHRPDFKKWSWSDINSLYRGARAGYAAYRKDRSCPTSQGGGGYQARDCSSLDPM